jgi:drug/metabolite transporter (DMT)-like permease
MTWMALLGAIALIFGVLLVVSPNSLVRMSEGLNKMVTRVDEQVIKYRIGFGVVLIISAVFLFAYAYLSKRY